MSDSSKKYEDYVSILYDNGKNIVENWIDNDKQNISSWLSLGSTLAELVDKFTELSGIEKKNMVIKAVILLVEDKDVIKNLDDNTRTDIINVIKLTLPTTLDLIIKATRGEIKINKKCNFLCFECIKGK